MKGLSQEQLGEICGFRFSYIGGVERGERNISLENIEKIAQALGIETNKLFEFDESLQMSKSNESKTLLNEIHTLLQGRDLKEIRMAKNILVEIFNCFPRK